MQIVRLNAVRQVALEGRHWFETISQAKPGEVDWQPQPEGIRSMSEEKTGHARLFDALTTKGTAFTHPERRKLRLLGLLPTAEQTLA